MLIRIDDAPRVGQRVAGQVVIGDQHLDAETIGFGHAFDAGNAVIDCDNHIGLFFTLGEFHDLWCEAVTILKAVGHQIVDSCAHGSQRAHADRARGGAVGIVVGDDQ